MCSDQAVVRADGRQARSLALVPVHCENASLITMLEDQAAEAGQPDSGPRTFARTRPPEAEEESAAVCSLRHRRQRPRGAVACTS